MVNNSYIKIIRDHTKLPSWKSKLPHLWIELTERCNNDCIHCYINQPQNDAALKKKEITILRKLARLVQFQIVELVQVGMRDKYKIKNMDRQTFLAILARYGETLDSD